MISELRKVLKRLRYPLEVMLVCTRWYAAYPLSFRHLEEMIAKRAIDLHGLPEKITIDKSGANTAVIKSVNGDAGLDIELQQSKYLNNIVEQDQRAVKRITDPMMGFKSFWSAQKLIAGIETMHMVKKGQLQCPGGQPMSAADQFYSLAF